MEWNRDFSANFCEQTADGPICLLFSLLLLSFHDGHLNVGLSKQVNAYQQYGICCAFCVCIKLRLNFWFLILWYMSHFQVMDFLNDAVVSMDAFVNAYRTAAVFFSCPVDARYSCIPVTLCA